MGDKHDIIPFLAIFKELIVQPTPFRVEYSCSE
jgi:hypothetical protein